MGRERTKLLVVYEGICPIASPLNEPGFNGSENEKGWDKPETGWQGSSHARSSNLYLSADIS